MSINDPNGAMTVTQDDGLLEKYWLLWLLELASVVRTQSTQIQALEQRVQALENP